MFLTRVRLEIEVDAPATCERSHCLFFWLMIAEMFNQLVLHGTGYLVTALVTALVLSIVTKCCSWLLQPKKKARSHLIKILVNGNIGSGKSTVCASVHGVEIEGLICHSVLESINQRHLVLYQSDMKRYTFGFQLNAAQTSGINMERHNWTLNPETDVSVVDRDLFGNMIFAIRGFLHGHMTELESEALMEQLHLYDMTEVMRRYHASAMVYLYALPKRCQATTKSRAGVDQDVKEDYLNELHDLQNYAVMDWWVKKRPVPLHAADWTVLGDDQTGQVKRSTMLIDRIIRHVKREQASPNVSFLTAPPIGLDQKSFERVVANEDRTVALEYDDPSVLELMPEGSLPGLPKKYRLRHKAEWMNRFISYAAREWKILLVKRNVTLTMLDFFSTLPQAMLPKKEKEK